MDVVWERNLAGFEDLIRDALSKQDDPSPQRRAAIYQSSRQALERMLGQNATLDDAAMAAQRDSLEKAIASIEGDYASTAAPSPEPPPPVTPAPVTSPPLLTSETGEWTTTPVRNEYNGPISEGQIGMAAGDLLPIMTMPPEYPERLRGRAIEGWVIVEFVVDELGRVRSPRIVEGYPASVFDRAALNAVSRYKYKPRVVNGAAVPVSGVRQRIVFNLG